jgi:hypothetical protein
MKPRQPVEVANFNVQVPIPARIASAFREKMRKAHSLFTSSHHAMGRGFLLPLPMQRAGNETPAVLKRLCKRTLDS